MLFVSGMSHRTAPLEVREHLALEEDKIREILGDLVNRGALQEAMISAYLLGRHQGQPDERIRQQILAALRYVLRQQVRPESDWNVAFAAGLLWLMFERVRA